MAVAAPVCMLAPTATTHCKFMLANIAKEEKGGWGGVIQNPVS